MPQAKAPPAKKQSPFKKQAPDRIDELVKKHLGNIADAENAFKSAMWAEALKQPGESSHERSPVIHAVYRLDGAFNIQKHYTTGEGSEGEITVVAHAEPSGDSDELNVKFSELGRPPAYEGKTELTIRPKEKRVLVLPEIELGPGEKLATVVTLEYRVEDKENGAKISIRDQLNV